MKSKFVLVFAGLILVCFSHSSAQVPQMINYQGKLTKSSGAPLDTTIQMVFSIYADSNGSVLKWTETQGAVKVEKGIFNVLLGSTNPIPDTVFNGSIRYLGVTVGGDPEITPRKPMVSVPYAYRSTTGAGDNDWTIKGDTIYHLNGNVGIGTTSPAQKLSISGGGINLDSGYGIYWPNSCTYGGGFGLTFATTNNILFVTGGQCSGITRMVLDGTTGNFGIGTVSPGYPLEVKKAAANIAVTSIENTDAAGHGLAVRTTNTENNKLAFSTYNNTNTRYDFAVTNAGNTGVGISNPGAKLQVVGGDAAITTQGNGLILRATNGTNCYRITVDNSGTLSTTLVTCP